MPQRWSTMDVPKAAQFARWRELICEAFLALTPESDLRDGFAGTVAQRQLSELSIARITSQRQQVRRTSRDIDRSAYQGYYINLQVRGSSLMTQDGRSNGAASRRHRDRRHHAALRLRLPGRLPAALLFAPKELLTLGSGMAATGTDAAPVTTATASAPPPALAPQSATLCSASTHGDLAEDTAARLAAHACGILAIALDQRTEPHPWSTPLRQDRLHAAALADIDEHLTDADLSAAAVATRLGVSVRLLYAVFAGRRHSFAAEVRRGAWTSPGATSRTRSTRTCASSTWPWRPASRTSPASTGPSAGSTDAPRPRCARTRWAWSSSAALTSPAS